MKYYFKGTKANMVSFYDPNFVYHLGLNVHPNPDTSNVICGAGIHLAKSVDAVKKYAPQSEEYYLAKADPKDILSEDFTKVRVSKCIILNRIPNTDLYLYDFTNLQYPICGEEWLEQHMFDFTWEDYFQQRLEIVSSKQNVVLSAKMKKADIRHIIKAVV